MNFMAFGTSVAPANMAEALSSTGTTYVASITPMVLPAVIAGLAVWVAMSGPKKAVTFFQNMVDNRKI